MIELRAKRIESDCLCAITWLKKLNDWDFLPKSIFWKKLSNSSHLDNWANLNIQVYNL